MLCSTAHNNWSQFLVLFHAINDSGNQKKYAAKVLWSAIIGQFLIVYVKKQDDEDG